MKWLFPVAMLALVGWLSYLDKHEDAGFVFLCSLIVAWCIA